MSFDSDSEEDDACPLCLDQLDLTDRHFKPCRCGYQICRFCWNRIMEESSITGSPAKCPACRTEYTGKNYNKELSQEELLRIERRRREKAAKKSSRSDLTSSGTGEKPSTINSNINSTTNTAKDKDNKRTAALHHQRGHSADAASSAGSSAGSSSAANVSSGSAVSGSAGRSSVTAAHEAAASGARKNLNAVRVIQRNLVYVTNIATTLAKEDVLKRHEYFGQYGRIVKIVVNRGTVHHTAHGQSVSAYVTFHKKADALACILAVDGATLENRVLRASFGTTKYCNFFLRAIPCSNPECVPADHEILTDRGFMDLAAYQAASSGGDCPPRVAGYNVDSRQLCFEVPHSLVTKDGEHQLVELASSTAHPAALDICVTLEHDLFVRDGDGRFEKVPASTFVAPDSDRAALRQLAHATGGVQQSSDSAAPFAAVCATLGLDTTAKAHAFLELYGVWLANGSLGMRDGLPVVVRFHSSERDVAGLLDALGMRHSEQFAVTESSWCQWWLAEYGHLYDGAASGARRYDAVSSGAGSFMEPEAGSSAKWLASWVWSLNMEQMRLVLRGVRGASRQHIWTASTRFRDELMRAALMAGYSAHFVASTADKRWWCVMLTDNARLCEPLLSKQRDTVRQVPFDGRVWCFTMPSGFVWVRRVRKDAATGAVIAASRPLLTGNCMYLHEIGDDADSFTKEDMQGGKSNFYEQIHAANMVNKVAPPAPAGARRKTLLPPAGTVSGGFRLYGPKMNPERSGPAPLTLASVPITVTGGGKRTISTSHSGGVTLGSATGARIGYSPPKSAAAAAAAAAAQSTWGTWTVPTRAAAAAAPAATPAPSISTPSSTGDIAWADIASKGLTSSAGAAIPAAATPTPAAASATAAAAPASTTTTTTTTTPTTSTAPSSASTTTATSTNAASANESRSRFAFASQTESESVSDELEERAATPPFIDVSQADWPTQLRTLMPNARVRFSTQANVKFAERGAALVENSPSHVAAPAHEVRAIMIEMFVRDRCRPYLPPLARD